MRMKDCLTLRLAALVAAFVLIEWVTGCAMPGAPQPPSLKLPAPVTDLSAVRAGDRVTLSWTMPRRNTDKLELKGHVVARICRREGSAESCQPAGAGFYDPGTAATFSEALPPALVSGKPRPIAYFVELVNRNNRSAGQSNPAWIAAGAVPAPVTGLAATVRKPGVVFSWQKSEAPAAIRLERRRLSAPAKATNTNKMLAPATEPAGQSLLIEPEDDSTTGAAIEPRAIDRTIDFGQIYEYRAQRLVRLEADGHPLELASELSAPLRVEALDLFPPAVPTALAAVATLGDASNAAAHPAIDLSWQPVTDADLAGYILYRSTDNGPWQRISAPEPLIGPAFRDLDVAPGRHYRYAVSSVDQLGHESARSAETSESLPDSAR